MTRLVGLAVLLGGALLGVSAQAGDDSPGPERRALAYLTREVPRWRPENGCYSCHNNGDAARALYVARTLPEFADRVAPQALENSTAWLVQPEGWDHNGGEGPFSDKRLAAIQFAAALATAVETQAVRDRSPLQLASRRLVTAQAEDGSFPIDGPDALGTPATYGRPLATALTVRTLSISDARAFQTAITRAEHWLRSRPARNTLDAAAVLLISRRDHDGPAVANALDLLRRGQGPDGGWGPYVAAPPEVFDTALALLALAPFREHPDVLPLLRQGRSFLIAAQADDGSWPETTRPSGGESYAQRLSTTGWATLALLATR
jgi:hypothetical protein